MGKIEIGDRIKMSDELKKSLIENDSKEHVEEFGDCEGIVESWMFPDLKDVKDVNVRWKPSGLRYGYNINSLIKLND